MRGRLRSRTTVLFALALGSLFVRTSTRRTFGAPGGSTATSNEVLWTFSAFASIGREESLLALDTLFFLPVLSSSTASPVHSCRWHGSDEGSQNGQDQDLELHDVLVFVCGK